MSLPNVMVIDDDPLVGEALAEGIIDRGGQCRTFTDPGRVTEHDWRWASFAVLDLQLGEQDGPQLLRRCRDLPDPPRLILVSGFDPMVLDASARAARDMGFDVAGSIPKPIPMARLARLLTAGIAEQALALPSAPRIARDLLADAIDHGEIGLAYQPQFDLRTGSLAGLEALARWESPAMGGKVPAESFAMAAEEHLLAGRLTEHVVARAVSDIRRWAGRGFLPRVSINLSGAVLDDATLVDRLRRLIGTDPELRERITFELTETAAAQLRDTALETLVRLRLAGFGLSLDDFGAGQNRFDRLIDAPITELKLDKRFAARLDTEAGLRIVRGLAAYSHALGAKCVAEGIETEAQRHSFREAGCDIGQGWLLGRPLAARDFDRRMLG